MSLPTSGNPLGPVLGTLPFFRGPVELIRHRISSDVSVAKALRVEWNLSVGKKKTVRQTLRPSECSERNEERRRSDSSGSQPEGSHQVMKNFTEAANGGRTSSLPRTQSKGRTLRRPWEGTEESGASSIRKSGITRRCGAGASPARSYRDDVTTMRVSLWQTDGPRGDPRKTAPLRPPRSGSKQKRLRRPYGTRVFCDSHPTAGAAG